MRITVKGSRWRVRLSVLFSLCASAVLAPVLAPRVGLFATVLLCGLWLLACLLRYRHERSARPEAIRLLPQGRAIVWRQARRKPPQACEVIVQRTMHWPAALLGMRFAERDGHWLIFADDMLDEDFRRLAVRLRAMQRGAGSMR